MDGTERTQGTIEHAESSGIKQNKYLLLASCRLHCLLASLNNLPTATSDRIHQDEHNIWISTLRILVYRV